MDKLTLATLLFPEDDHVYCNVSFERVGDEFCIFAL